MAFSRHDFQHLYPFVFQPTVYGGGPINSPFCFEFHDRSTDQTFLCDHDADQLLLLFKKDTKKIMKVLDCKLNETVQVDQNIWVTKKKKMKINPSFNQIPDKHIYLIFCFYIIN